MTQTHNNVSQHDAQPCMPSAQSEFDDKYITGSEIMRELDVTRASLLHARRYGKLPDPITVNDGRMFIWLRAEVAPHLEKWKLELQLRRGY